MSDYELRKGLPEELILRLQNKAMRSIEDFSICFVLENEFMGSGTLVEVAGELGILTAYHVAKELMSQSEKALTIIIGAFLHRFELPREEIEHVVIGLPNPSDLSAGPDLSFIRLLSPEKISTLKSIKSFCRLDAKLFEEWSKMPPEALIWWTAGAPASLSIPMTSTSREGAGRAGFLVASVSFVERIKDATGFDVLKISINTGPPPFTDDYRGYSGGGIWVGVLTKEFESDSDDTIDIDAARLAGVMYYQGDLIDGRRMISANGPDSLLMVLKARATNLHGCESPGR
jgi:hypothetical protein